MASIKTLKGLYKGAEFNFDWPIGSKTRHAPRGLAWSCVRPHPRSALADLAALHTVEGGAPLAEDVQVGVVQAIVLEA